MSQRLLEGGLKDLPELKWLKVNKRFHFLVVSEPLLPRKDSLNSKQPSKQESLRGKDKSLASKVFILRMVLVFSGALMLFFFTLKLFHKHDRRVLPKTVRSEPVLFQKNQKRNRGQP